MDRVPHLVRPLLLVAPGAILLVVYYQLDYPYPDLSAYPAHVWSAFGAVAGWWLLLAALVLISGGSIATWVALLSAIALGGVSFDGGGVTIRSASSWLGVLGACLVLLIAVSNTLVSTLGRRRALIGSLVLCAAGIGAFALNSAFQSSPIWNGPPGLLVASLVLTPGFVLARRPWLWSRLTPVQPQSSSLPLAAPPVAAPPDAGGSLFHNGVFDEVQWPTNPAPVATTSKDELTPDDRARFGPPKRFWLAGCPWWGWVWLLIGASAVNDVAEPFRLAGFRDPLADVLAIAVVILVGGLVLIVGPKIRTALQLWLDRTAAEWERLDSKAWALQKLATGASPSDATSLSEAEALYKQALAVAEASNRPLLIATASNNLAGVYGQENRIEDAIPLFERAWQLRAAYAGASNEATLDSIQRLASAYLTGGRQGDAARLQSRLQ
jgi:hypothetical protein